MTTEERINKIQKYRKEISELKAKVESLPEDDVNLRHLNKKWSDLKSYLAAMAWGDWVLSQNDEYKFRGMEWPCYYELQKRQPQSSDWAMKHENWKIEPMDQYLSRVRENINNAHDIHIWYKEQLRCFNNDAALFEKAGITYLPPQVNETLQKIMDEYPWNERQENIQKIYGYNAKIYDVAVENGFSFYNTLASLGFTPVPVAMNPAARWLMIDDDHMTTITYVEGDLILTIHENHPSYFKELRRVNEFYSWKINSDLKL